MLLSLYFRTYIVSFGLNDNFKAKDYKNKT